MKKRIISLVLVVATLFAMSSIAFTANAYHDNMLVSDGGGRSGGHHGGGGGGRSAWYNMCY